MLGNHSTTYLRLSDILFLKALHGDDTEKRRCVLAMKAILLVRNVNEASVSAIRHNLQLLGASKFELDALRNKSRRVGDLQLRTDIASMFAKDDL